ncbi:MAG: uracil-DNA glycosylase [Ignavibacteria bacterium]
MSNEKINKVITEAENTIRNFERFYNKRLYIDSDLPERVITPQIAEPTENMTVKKKKVDSGGVNAKDKAAVAEIDIFGNENIKREEWEFSETLDELNNKIKDCKKCDLWKTRTNFVFGVGNPKADVVVIGEAPGAYEDAQGEPFVGRAGQLLNKILQATGFNREDVFICNILKSRPPGNRNPLPEEVELCKPYLDKQLKLINPKLILLLGKVASESLLKTKEPLAKLRGKTHDYKGWKVRVTFHPAALLRNPNWKRPTWDDMLQLKEMYEQLTGKKLESKKEI